MAVTPALNSVLISDVEQLAMALFQAYESGASNYSVSLPAESFSVVGKNVTLTPAPISIAISIK